MRLHRLTSCAVTAALLWPWPIILTPLPARADVASPPASRVIIEEVAWAGSNLSTMDEWIELANLGDATATIAGWSLRGAGESGRIIFFPPDASIAPHGTYIISNYIDSDPKCSLAVTVNLATSTVSLSNSALGVELRDANGAAMDRAGSGKAPLAGSVTPKATMIRVSAASSGDQATDWMSATTTVGFDQGVTDFGTPGFCDLCTSVGVTSDILSDASATDTLSDTASTTDALPLIEAADTGELILDNTSATSDVSVLTLDDMTVTSTTLDVVLGDATATDDGADTRVRPYGDAETTTSTETIDVETASSTETTLSESSNATDTTATVQTPSAPLVITLNEIMSNPASGKEWVELFVHDADATSTDRMLELWDSSSRIATITTGTPINAERMFVVTLSSSRLNNDGDSASLLQQDGVVLDSIAIPALNKGVAWARLSTDGAAWAETDIATPGAGNIFPIPVMIPVPSVAVVSTPTVQATQSVAATSTNVARTNVSTAKKTAAKTTSSTSTTAKAVSTSKTSASSVKTPTATTTKIVKTTVIASNAKKPTSTKQTTNTTASLTHLSFDSMFDPEMDTVRVRVTGTVGSVDRLLGAAHTFILHGADGRGVIVYLPTHLNIPPFGATVRVMGTLTATYRGPELRMKTSDVWMTVATTTPPVPRSVDLIAPGSEDAWSLVAATGTVQAVTARSFTIDADGVEIAVNIPSALRFRTKRLIKGDVVRVTALLDLRKDTPALLPRTPEEIELIEHAPSTITSPSASANTTSGPDWKPFGAAAGVLAMTGAAKRVNEIWRRRRLAAQAVKAGASMGA
jgi:hypothetical protein